MWHTNKQTQFQKLLIFHDSHRAPADLLKQVIIFWRKLNPTRYSKSGMESLSSAVSSFSLRLVRYALTNVCSQSLSLRSKAASLSSQAWSTSSWGTSPRPMTKVSTTTHVNCKSWTGSDLLNHIIEGFLQQHFGIFARTLQYFCNFILHFCNTFHLHWGSTALLWSKKRHVTNTRHQPTSGMRKWWFFVTNAGSQLTFMTQNEKVMIFHDQRGVTTDLHNTEWESDDFSWPTRGHNRPFRCLDYPGALHHFVVFKNR